MQQISDLDIVKRFEQNPLLTPQDIKPSRKGMMVVRVLNPGVFRFDRKIWLLIRVVESPEQKEGYVSIAMHNKVGKMEILQFAKTDPRLDFSDSQLIHYDDTDYLPTISHLRLMCSEDGESFHEPENYDAIFGDNELEAYGIEDCSVAEINNVFHITYTMVSPNGVGIGLMQTRDWKRFDRRGMIFPPHNKNCTLFEEKIHDKYYALHSPSSSEPGGNYIWLAESSDAIHWGRHMCVATTRKNMWDSARIGAGCSPVETPRGWLTIYHGADENDRYCLGALLLDINEPSRVIARSELPLMEPSESYELNGLFGNAILSNGHLVIGDKLRLYYSASDQGICRAELSIKEILGSLSPQKK